MSEKKVKEQGTTEKKSHFSKVNTTGRRPLPVDIHDYIRVRHANEHNLKGVDVNIPRGTLTVFTA